MNINAQPVILIKNIASAIKLLPLALPFFSVDLKGISPISNKVYFLEIIDYKYSIILNFLTFRIKIYLNKKIIEFKSFNNSKK